MKKRKILVAVAHPDDETIWMGGYLLRNKDIWDITIISLCRENDKDRAPKFKKVCGIFNAKSYMSDLEDDELLPLDKMEVIDRLKKFINLHYDYIFTHGEEGEYGHIRHKEIHKAVSDMLKKRIVRCEKVFYFSYKKKGNSCLYDSNANKFIKLKDDEFLMKKKIIKEIYGFSEGSFEEQSCGKIESFNLIKNEMFDSLSLSS